MGRPSKNPDNPLVRLRTQLSTPSRQFTRLDLAKKTGIPESTLKDIELGVFKMTKETAMKIAFATKVFPPSLMRGQNPLRDWGGKPVSPDSPEPVTDLRIVREAMLGLFEGALETAQQAKRELWFYYSFELWIEEVSKQLKPGKKSRSVIRKAV